ncbi:unnamed protein product [Sphagnum compactum]
MEQLMDMGFSRELAAQALAATGGKSTLTATEWILSHRKMESINTTVGPSSRQQQPESNLTKRLRQGEPLESQQEMPAPVVPHSQSPLPLTVAPSGTPGTSGAAAAGMKTPLWSGKNQVPLAERMRPMSVDDIVGQDHLLGPRCILRSLLDNNSLSSIILWGPPGTGKTSLVRSIARSVSFRFVSLSAVSSGVKEVREVLEESKRLQKFGQRTLLFLDEIHRFNKAQQDTFLPYVEAGHIVLIGATTENPSFEINAALLSRCRVLMLNKLQPDHIQKLLERAILDREKGVLLSIKGGSRGDSVKIEEDALRFLSHAADGDARVALNSLEIAGMAAFAAWESNLQRPQMDEWCSSTQCEAVKDALQRSHVLYDKTGDEHYNIISALHKSMRGGDADAAIYWLARMLEGGEGPLYVARRLVRFASEDIGLADPQALVLAVACYQACHFLGMPECNVNLAQCVVYLSLAPKSVIVYNAIVAAQRLVRESEQNEPVPLHLRNAPTQLMKDLGYSKGYIYPPNHVGPVEQEYLPPSLRGHTFLQWDKEGADH